MKIEHCIKVKHVLLRPYNNSVFCTIINKTIIYVNLKSISTTPIGQAFNSNLVYWTAHFKLFEQQIYTEQSETYLLMIPHKLM